MLKRKIIYTVFADDWNNRLGKIPYDNKFQQIIEKIYFLFKSFFSSLVVLTNYRIPMLYHLTHNFYLNFERITFIISIIMYYSYLIFFKILS